MAEQTGPYPLVADDTQLGDKETVLGQYTEYLSSATEWDKNANASEKFFSTLNLAMLSGYLVVLKREVEIPVPILIGLLAASIWFPVMWILTNVSYAKAVSIKMEVAQEMERYLPLQPFKYEWEEKFRKRGYIRISRIQRVFPIIFIILYLMLGVALIRQDTSDQEPDAPAETTETIR